MGKIRNADMCLLLNKRNLSPPLSWKCAWVFRDARCDLASRAFYVVDNSGCFSPIALEVRGLLQSGRFYN